MAGRSGFAPTTARRSPPPAFGGLSRLSVLVVKAGIEPERIAPGKPQQNGRRERMHLTGSVRNFVRGAIIASMEGEYGDQADLRQLTHVRGA
jgi:hypothetical protein